MSEARYLGPYRIGDEVGKGGMGTVFRGEHAKTGEVVAVKLIAEQVADSEQFRRRFAGEIESLKRVDHPHIAKLIGYGEESGRLFYAMELVEGPTLRERLIKEKRLSWQETLEIGIQVSSALQHAHILGIIHRDLKPANLLFDGDGQIKLVDFGINKAWDSSATVAGSVLGTADYMAPEQAGEGAITIRTDLYALGSVLYACLVGRPPFGGKELTTLIQSLRHETPAPLDLIVPETPNELSELVHELLQKKPEKRPPTARAVNNRLKAIRLGLQRAPQATFIDAEHPTQSDGTNITRVPDEANTASPLETGKISRDQPTLDATIESIPGNGQTADGSGDADQEPQPSADETPTPASRFQIVDEAERRRIVFNEADPPATFDWQHWLSVTALVGLLVAIVGFAIWMMQAPSADALYQQIAAAEATGQLGAAETDMQEFLRRFPDDPRSATVRSWAGSIDLERTLRRLKLAAIQAGGIAQLPPAEQSFLEAMQLRERDPVAARGMLQQWLTIFGRPLPGDDAELGRLSRLAKEAVATLASDRPADDDQRQEALRRRIAWAARELSATEQRTFLQGLVALYEDKPWATEPLADAHQRLGSPQPASGEEAR